MTQFALNPAEIQNGYDNAIANPYVPERDSAPGFFEGSLSSIGTGFERGELEVMNLFAPEDSIIQDTLPYAKPDPQVTGWLGQVLYGVSSALPAITAGTILGGPAGGAALLGASKAWSKAKELEAEGVDPATAIKASAVEGVTQAAGVMMPAAIPGSIATKAVSGAAMNVGLGAGYRGATGKILEANGYKDMAEQYKVLDSAAIFTDAILGTGFGLLHQGAGHPEALPSQRDAALAANDIHQFEVESAPGIPADIATRNSHTEAMATATEQVLRGEAVDVSQAVKESSFVRKPTIPEVAKANEEIRAEYRNVKSPEISLLKFIADRGGIEDTGGELTGMDAHLWHRGKYFQRKLVRASKEEMGKKLIRGLEDTSNDFTPDEVTRAAWEAGYFPDFGENRPTPNDLFEAVRQELVGKKRFRGNEESVRDIDPEEMNNYYYNRAQELEVNTDNLSPDDIILAVHEREAILGEDSPDNIEAAIDHRLRALDIPFEDTNGQVAKQQNKVGTSAGARAGQEPAPSKTRDDTKDGEASGVGIEGAEQIAKEVIAEKPDLQIASEDGALTAQEALTKADEAITKAKDDSKLFEAAINCFIRNGNES